MTNIKSITSVGIAQTHDLEVDHVDHQYYLSNGMLTSNSHATLYSMVSYHAAWLKANHPIEFLVSNLISEVSSTAKAAKENILKIKSEIRSIGVKIVPPDINTSELSWKIVGSNKLMSGLDSLKFMGSDAIPELLKKRPFTSFQDLIYRTDSSKVRSTSIQAMAASGSLDSFGFDRKLMFHYASDYRAKLRAHMDKLEKAWVKDNVKKGFKESNVPAMPESMVQRHLNDFEYPFPKLKPWTLQEQFALEDYYLGEGISGDTFDRYPKFFDREETIPFEALRKMYPWKDADGDERKKRKSNTHYLENIRPIEAIITSMFVFTVKKEDSPIFGMEMARFTIQDAWGDESSLLAFPEAWEGMKTRIEKELSRGSQKIEPGIAIRFLGLFQWENDHVASFVLNDIISYKSFPALPEDRASKKVKMPKAKRLNISDIVGLSNEDLFDKLEEEILEHGMSTIDDEDDIKV